MSILVLKKRERNRVYNKTILTNTQLVPFFSIIHSALVPESRDALAKYTSDLESFLGEESTMDQFKVLETGDYVDFIPNTWMMKQDALVAEQQRELLRKNAKDIKAAGTAVAINRKQKAAGKMA